jgi:hypothetical protein
MWGEDTNIGFSLTTRRCLLYEQQVPNSGLYDMDIEEANSGRHQDYTMGALGYDCGCYQYRKRDTMASSP